MGLVSKHGILMVEVANELRLHGKAKREAIIEAASVRLRPILMTTAAMVLGVVPLITAAGAGANSRFNMGLVIASGLAIGTLFTLFVVPAFYIVLAHGDKAHEGEDEHAPRSRPRPARSDNRRKRPPHRPPVSGGRFVFGASRARRDGVSTRRRASTIVRPSPGAVVRSRVQETPVR